MLKRIWIIILLLIVLLTACQRGQDTPVVESTDQPTAAPTQPAAQTGQGETAMQATCTVVSSFTAAESTEQSPFPAVSESDWVKGPETARVTITEYSDFQ